MEGNYLMQGGLVSSWERERLLRLSLTPSQNVTKRLRVCKRIRTEGKYRRSIEIEESWSAGGREDYLNLV